MQWNQHTTGQRIKLLRGAVTQEELAEGAGLSIATIRKAEQDRGQLSLPTLLRLAHALGADISVIVGQQAPRRAMLADDRTTLRELSRTVHDTAAGIGTDREPVDFAADLVAGWDAYRAGRIGVAGQFATSCVKDAAAALADAGHDRRMTARGVLADAYRLASYVANQLGARDLAYAAIGHAADQARQGGDPVREASVASGRSWIYLRDARLDEAERTAAVSYTSIEPTYGDRDPVLLATYGWHVTFAAVVAARQENTAAAEDLLSQGSAIAARLGRDVMVNGTAFGPAAVTAQAVGIAVSTGKASKALHLATSVHDWSALHPAAHNRLQLDIALAQCATKQYDTCLDTLLTVCQAHPEWVRHQTLPGVIAQRAGHATTSRSRKIAKIIGATLA
ncbi:helix-turn-helix domain-containing protein [Streptomyces sp. ISL-94]|uniref:helix-turn-helix domain-containing protein n=1 Tax=Streptomyces sp. ISL-94 TaxID=2819190 RepID=UPI001BE93AF3|nr:helix-turn-helix transcriptional regulator [Streptomyces sp. ISL-94]MBT2480797.1 helix-turn-helix transcriptional regulator [Streptomyces sp. ISL-94]